MTHGIDVDLLWGICASRTENSLDGPLHLRAGQVPAVLQCKYRALLIISGQLPEQDCLDKERPTLSANDIISRFHAMRNTF